MFSYQNDNKVLRLKMIENTAVTKLFETLHKNEAHRNQPTLNHPLDNPPVVFHVGHPLPAVGRPPEVLKVVLGQAPVPRFDVLERSCGMKLKSN